VKNQILGNYLFHLVPAILVPLLVYFDDRAIPLANLLKISFLFPLLLLAMRGLTTYFPKENRARRSTGHMAEYAILQGAVFAGAMVLYTGLSSWNPEPDLGRMLRQFFITATVWSVASFAFAFHDRQKLNSPDA
jgi:hypothetical protein